MASAPRYKIFDSSGTYQGSLKEPEACAAVLALYGDGAKIRLGHGGPILWHEGAEHQAASESWDEVALTMRRREVDAHTEGLRALGCLPTQASGHQST